MSIRTKTLALLLAVSIVISTAGTAFAQDDNGYENGGENLAGTLQGPEGTNGTGNGTGDQGTGAVEATTAVPAATGAQGDGDGGSLPFTGLDVVLILGVGGALVAAGLVTRRLTRPADTA